ncbi:unnamed protein product [Lymnaea stagnalis]|uniref:APCDD1 domain-containing protein n=1 Tax=Lymnaea stagnalis TaxID=6523 RepID=A0AAV2HSQ3_LYMST
MAAANKWILLRLIAIYSVLVVTSGSNPHFVYREDWTEKSCARVLHKVRHQMVSTPLPPDVRGDWVSYRCEIRSGPEYVIRHFVFKNGTFEAVLYRFSDPDCHHPMYAIQSWGTHRLTQASWTVRGGTEAEYDVTSAYVIPYTVNATQELSGRLAEGCGLTGLYTTMMPFSKYLIYSLPPHLDHSHHHQAEVKGRDPNQDGDVDCFHALNFTLHELQLVMVELRRHHHGYHHHHHHHGGNKGRKSLSDNDLTGSDDIPLDPADAQLTRELLLGAVHSKPEDRQSHRPSSFQTALKDGHTPGCGVCSRIMSSSALYPPRLTSHAGTLLSLEGEWVSTRCESRQYGMFLTRWLHFLPDGASWQGQYDYYHDALCRHPSFSLNAKGNYAGGTDSTLVHGAKDYSFKVTRLKVIPHDQATVDSMNHYGGNGCGKAHGWAVGQEQDVTKTGGCVTLGIRLPNMERDIMKMEVVHRKLHLYVGQRLIDRKPGTSYQKERPTAFQEPLVKCDQVDLDMSINTAPGGHSWAGAVALPLSAGPDLDAKNSKNPIRIGFCCVLVSFFASIQMSIILL